MTPPLPHVLLAEDNAMVGAALRILFEETGHRFTLAPSIVETVRTCRAGRVDLLLLDLGLADGDGLDALAQLSSSGALPRVCVAMTGQDERDVRERCIAAGCRAVLTKPVPTRDLLRMTREWLAPMPTD